MRKKLLLLISLSLAFALVFSTVSFAFSSVPVKSISLSTTKTTLEVGKTVSLKVTIKPSNATNKTVIWSTSNSKIATVDAKGVVKGVKAGTATIEAKSKVGGLVSKCTVTVLKPEPKIKMTMFMGNSGLAAPDGVDLSNNPYINIVEKYANVDLVLEVPGYADYMTKLNLLLASGNLPDIVHSYSRDATNQYGDQGAFIDLKKYYDKSAQVKKYISNEMMELAKSPKGYFYSVPMVKVGPQGRDTMARWDLVKKYNNDKWPTNVYQWVALFTKMQKAEPNSIVLSKTSLNCIFNWFGAIPTDYRYDYRTGKVCSTFELPEYKDAIQLLKQLYDQGILDKEFATLTADQGQDRFANRNELIEWNGINQWTPQLQVDIKDGWEMLAAPPLSEYPTGVSAKYTGTWRDKPISGHGIFISSKCKNPDRAWRVIEGFACDELYNAIFWGNEGVEYKVENGKKIPNPEAQMDLKHYWSLSLALVFGFTNGQDVKRTIGELGCGQQRSDEIWKHMDVITNQAIKNGIQPTSFTVLSKDAQTKLGDSQDFINQATYEAIMGKISMSEFDKRVSEFKDKYGFIDAEHTKYISDNKDQLAKYGVNFNR